MHINDTEKHAVWGFTGQWGDAPGSYKYIRYCRYFLEDKQTSVPGQPGRVLV